MSASVEHLSRIDDPGPLRAPRLQAVAAVLAVLGVVGFGAAFAVHGAERAWSAFLIGMLIPTLISLAALFYLSVHSIGAAVWTVPIRRILEGLSTGLWITLPAFLVLAVFGGAYLYDWVNLSGSAHHAELFHIPGGSKEAWMNFPRFLILNALLVVGWLVFRHFLVGMSLRQDEHGGSIRARHKPLAIAFVMFLAVSLTLFVWDLLLSLHVNWFSTMWGVYVFTSAVQTMLCTLVILCVWLRRGAMKGLLPKHVMHDLGTWMVAWSCFCAYIGFSQYMLIWYANLDEETFWYVARTQHGYGVQYVIEALIRWPLPFLGLMSQRVRTNPVALTVISALVLVGNWLDWNWLVNPAFAMNHYRWPFEWPELLLGAGFLGLFLLVVLRFWARNGLIAKRDPELLAAVNAEHLH